MTARLGRPAAVAALAFAVALGPVLLGEFGLTLMNYIGIYTLVALGLVLLTGSGGLTSFGQAAFVGLGAYTTAYLSTAWNLSPWFGLLAALSVSFVVALALGFATLHLGGHYLPITTIAWGVAIYLLFGNFEALGRYGGLGNIPPISVGSFAFDRTGRIYYLIWLAVGLAMLAAMNLLASRQGRAIRALRGGKVLAESLGIDSYRIKLSLFLISALLAALAGWLYAHMQRFVSPASFDLRTGIEFLLMAVLGGSGHVAGALVGAVAVTLVKNWLQDLLPLVTSNSGNLEIIAFGTLFILLLQYSPRGIVPFLLRFLPRPHAEVPGATGPRSTHNPSASFEAALHGAPQDEEAEAREGKKPALPSRTLPPPGSPILRVEGLTKRFGGLVAIDDVGFEVEAGRIAALIGPNGAGKSTTFNLVTGVTRPTAGRVVFAGRDVTGVRQRRLALAGIARTFQHVKLRPRMSLVENVMLGGYPRTATGLVAGALRLDRNDEAALRRLALGLLREVGLGDRPQELAGNLPLGQQRVLEIARALAADPILLMLDEPAAGLRAREKAALADLLRDLRRRGMTILLVEHDMEFLMGLADRVVVLDFGKKLAEGTPAEIRADRRVQDAYLGTVA